MLTTRTRRPSRAMCPTARTMAMHHKQAVRKARRQAAPSVYVLEFPCDRCGVVGVLVGDVCKPCRRGGAR